MIEPEPLDPQKLAKPQNPLDEAVKFIQPILQIPCKDVEAWIIAFGIYWHKNKVVSDRFVFHFDWTHFLVADHAQMSQQNFHIGPN